jgi:exodeoxyribonuclease VII small subunit
MPRRETLSTHGFDPRSPRVYRAAIALETASPMSTNEQNGLRGLEKSLEELEALVTRLESGELPLEQAIAEFERGNKLKLQCQAALQDAEQKVEILLKKTATAEPSAFAGAADEG